MKLYFSDHDPEFCYALAYHKKYMEENRISEMELTEAVRITGSEYFFCREFNELGEKGNCGKVCDKYAPTNGVSGKCKYNGYTYDYGENKLTLNLK